MMKKGAIILVLFVLSLVNVRGQKSLLRAYKALNEYNYFEARKLLKTDLAKAKVGFIADTSAKVKPLKNPQLAASAAFGLGLIYNRTDNPFSNVDTAYLYARMADSLYILANADQRAKLAAKKLPPDSVKIDSLFSLVYTRGYNEAMQLNTVAAYESYNNRFPQSPFVGQSSLQIELLDWDSAQKDNSYQAYQEFLQVHPSSKFDNEAKARYERRLFETLTIDNSLKSYKYFVENYPASPYRKDAEDSVFSKMTAAGMVSDYATFIRENPTNRNVDKGWESLYNLYNADGSEATLRKFKEEFPDYPGADRLNRDLQLAEKFLMPYEENGKWGYLDTTGKTILAPQFDYAEFFSDGLALVEQGGKIGYISKSGKWAVNAEFEEGTGFAGNYAIVKKNGKFGVIGRIGNAVLPFDYDDISSINHVTVNQSMQLYIATVTKGDKQGYIDLSGKFTFPTDLEEAGDFYQNMAVIKKDGKYGYINAEGKITITPQYDWADNFNEMGLARVRKDNLLGLINRQNIIVAPAKYNTMAAFENGFSLVSADGKYGFINPQGIEVIAVKYSLAFPFNYNAALNDTVAKVELKGKRSYINTRDKEVFPFKFDDVNGYGDGMLPAKQKGKWGYVDKKMKTLIPFKMDLAGQFKNGMALAGSEGKLGLIDKDGKWVVEPRYDEILDSYADDCFLVVKGEKYGLIDRAGAELLPVDYEEPISIVGDIFQLNANGKMGYYNLKKKQFVWKQ